MFFKRELFVATIMVVALTLHYFVWSSRDFNISNLKLYLGKNPSLVVVDPLDKKRYLSIIQQHGNNVLLKSQAEKCQIFFSSLPHNWKTHSFSKQTEDFTRELFESKTNWIRKVMKKDGVDFAEVDSSVALEYEKKYEIELQETTAMETQMISDIKTVAAYSKCFEAGTDGAKRHRFANLGDLDTKVYPYLSRKYPMYVRWNGERHYEPFKMSKPSTKLSVDEITEAQFKDRHESIYSAVDNDKAFFAEFRSKINGKGITLTSSDRFFEDTEALIRALRTVGNTLPVQIFHRGDLSPANQAKLAKLARGDMKPEKALEFFNNIRHKSPEMSSSFPKQDLWFVDVDRVIKDQYKDLFSGYLNKILAYAFTSFDETMLVDTDIVFFTNPASLFQSSQYKESGTLFYKDRSHDERVQDFDVNFFERMFPNLVDEEMFGINSKRKALLENRYLNDKFKHFMEAGVVCIKRSQYWAGLASTVQLSMWKPVMDRIWGDKELFWLGLSIAGLETYKFDEYYVASIGQISDNSLSKYKANEICSTHPGHISSDTQRLVWINSGVKTCKRASAAADNLKSIGEKYRITTEKALEDYYNSPLNITSAIIPPDSGLYKAENDKGYPSQGWKTSGDCFGYFWCAYDRIGDVFLPEYQGTLINFDHDMVQWHNYVASSYVGK